MQPPFLMVLDFATISYNDGSCFLVLASQWGAEAIYPKACRATAISARDFLPILLILLTPSAPSSTINSGCAIISSLPQKSTRAFLVEWEIAALKVPSAAIFVFTGDMVAVLDFIEALIALKD